MKRLFFSSEKAIKASKVTGIPLIIQDITSDYLNMLKNPPCGFGKYMNPCKDCHALMFRIAGSIMLEKGFDFLFSGEVLGQRPMSQTRQALMYVEKASGYEGYILRPLSAQKLSITIPEKLGIVNRSLLFGFEGRSRKHQFELAQHFNITQYPTPAGGCSLTDKGFSNRLKDLFKNQPNYLKKDLFLLTYGRHFRINQNLKIIVGRNEKENGYISEYYQFDKDILVEPHDFTGPTVLVPNAPNDYDYSDVAASLCIGYSKIPEATVKVNSPEKMMILKKLRINIDDIKKYLLI